MNNYIIEKGLLQMNKEVLTGLLHIIKAAEENIEFEWGIEASQQALQIGWGCPIEPFIQTIANGFGSQLLGYINYFIPISEMLGALTLWLIAIGGYYLASIILRWAKAVS